MYFEPLATWIDSEGDSIAAIKKMIWFIFGSRWIDIIMMVGGDSMKTIIPI